VPVQQLYQLFIDNIQQTRWQEWVSTIAQVASVWYAKKNNVWVYPTGIVGVLLAFWVYFFMATPPLYADGILNIYYFMMSVYGWYNWAQKKGDDQYNYPISWCSAKELHIGIALFVGFWIGIYILLISITDSNTPLLDSLVSATAVTAMWWMAKRKIENWLAWIVSNIIAVPLNFYKGFMLFVVMYVLFLVLAAMGFAAWKKKIKTTKA